MRLRARMTGRDNIAYCARLGPEFAARATADPGQIQGGTNNNQGNGAWHKEE